MSSDSTTTIYLDTSCAIRMFFNESQEIGCEAQAEKIRKLDRVGYVSSALLKIEWQSAIRSKRRNGVISGVDHQLILKCWDSFSRQIAFNSISEEIITSASRILTTSKVSGRVRSLDCIHFATFLYVRTFFPESVLFSADTVVCALAQEAGVNFFNPLKP